MSNEIIIAPNNATVAARKAQDVIAAHAKDGFIPKSVINSLPGDVRSAVREIIARSGIEEKTARELRKARITELIVHDDPDVVAKGIALSQKEDGVGLAPAQVNNFQFNHFATQEPPDGRKLCAKEEVIDVQPEKE